MTFSIAHDPQAKLDYGCNWALWLAAGETVTTSTWTATPSGLTLTASTHDTTSTTVWVAGGVASVRYSLTNHIITSAGREDDRTIVLSVQER